MRALAAGLDSTPLANVLGLAAEAVFFLNGAGTVTLPPAATGSANPATVGIQVVQAANVGFVGVAGPTLVLSASGGDIQATVTNPGADPAVVQIDFELQFVA